MNVSDSESCKMWACCDQIFLFSIMFSASVCVVATMMNYDWIIYHCADISYLVYSVERYLNCCTFWLFLRWYYEDLCINICVPIHSFLFRTCLRMELPGKYECKFNFWRTTRLLSMWLYYFIILSELSEAFIFSIPLFISCVFCYNLPRKCQMISQCVLL